jgi:hypothetical protein
MPRPCRLPGNNARHGGRLALSVALLLVTIGCASVEPGGPGPLRGASGSITWEVSNIGRVVSSDNQRVRWSYLINLKTPGRR